MKEQIPTEEYEALVALYHSTNGSNWTANDGWLDPNATSWHGITIWDGHVRRLSLTNNELKGELPTSLGLLTHLHDVYLSHNQLSGSIPPELGTPKGGEEFDLSHNQLTGRIPLTFTTSGVSYTFEFDLSHNKLTGPIPDGIETISWNIDLSHNHLEGSIPPGIFHGPVTSLYLNDNDFTGEIVVDPEAPASNLQILDLSNNHLEGTLDTVLNKLSSFAFELYLADNHFTGPIPPRIGTLRELSVLDLSHNEMEGPIPPEIGQLSHLLSLKLSDNQFSGILPDALLELDKLRTFFLEGNAFSNEPPSTTRFVPESEQVLSVLRDQGVELDLNFGMVRNQGYEMLVALYEATDGDNWINNDGWLDPDAEHWFGIDAGGGQVSNMSLPNNNLRGNLPQELAEFPFNSVDLSSNHLTGPIPGNLLAWTSFDLSHNQLSGELPEGFGENVFGWGGYNLSHNGLTGRIPETLIHSIPSINLSHNRFTTLPQSITTAGIALLSLSHNDLSGALPMAFGNIVELDLSSNRFRGEIPAELAKSDLWALNLSHNNLIGPIPTEFGNIEGLFFLNLSHNHLTGPIPAELGQLGLLELHLSTNALTGVLPPELLEPAKLQSLSISGNRFTRDANHPAFYHPDTEATIAGLLAKNVTLDLDLETFGRNIPAAEYQALTAFYEAMGGDDWTRNDGWLDPEASSWWGVQVTDGHARQISLTDNELVGTLPDALADLNMLNSLHVDKNQINTEAPVLAVLADANVTLRIDLPLDRRIPAKEYDALYAYYRATGGSAWRTADGWLTTTPDWFGVTVRNGHVVKLEHPNNNLHGTLPSELADLTQLETIILDDNALAGDLPSLGSTALIHVSLNANELSGAIPESLGDLRTLRTLSLADNQLDGTVPSALINLPNLRSLSLAGNAFDVDPISPEFLSPTSQGLIDQLIDRGVSLDLPRSVPIREAISSREYETLVNVFQNLNGRRWDRRNGWLQEGASQWEGLRVDDGHVRALELPDNHLAGVLTGDLLAGLPHLRSLDLARNQLSGVLPTDLGELADLEFLRLGNNDFTGEVPTEVGQLTSLVELSLDHNDLVGGIPAELGQLSKLWRLDLSHNQFQGDFPRIQSLTNLRALDLSHNEVSGTLPPSISQLSRLRWLNLQQNDLEGPIPTQIADLTRLYHLDLGGNTFAGTIPSDFHALQNLEYLGLSENQLTGSIPDFLGEFSQLRTLDLRQNAFEGSIPETLRSALSLERLDLSSNQLRGKLPHFSPQNNLRWLDLSYNQFAGPLTSEFSTNLTEIETLILGNNQLTGPILSQFIHMDELRQLDLGYNRFTGPIPSELGNLQLERLDLGYNQFSGSIPVALTKYANLRWLDLSGNRLQDNLPSEFGDLSSLQFLYLNDNQLTGTIPPSFGNLKHLIALALQDNQLTGTIPVELSTLEQLWSLDLSGNALTGHASQDRPTAAARTEAPVPRIAGIHLEDGILHFSVAGPVGHTYVIEASSDLTPGFWDPISPPITATAPESTWIRARGPEESQFYRIATPVSR